MITIPATHATDIPMSFPIRFLSPLEEPAASDATKIKHSRASQESKRKSANGGILYLKKKIWRMVQPRETWMADTKGPYVDWYGMQQVPLPAQKKWMSMIVFVTFASNVLIKAFLDPPAASFMLKSLRTLSP